MSVIYTDSVWGPPDDAAQMLDAAVIQMRGVSRVSGTRTAHERDFFRICTEILDQKVGYTHETPLDVLGEGRHGLSNW